MKLYFILIIVFFLNNCSFDNKTGIWINENAILEEENDQFKEFKKISSSQEIFNQIIPLEKELQIKLPDLIQPNNWNEIFYNNSNNYVNFDYKYLNQIQLKTKKLTKHVTREHILFSKNNLIFSDVKGNIIFYSLNEKKIKNKFNFYKKKFKKFKKKLNLVIDDRIIYVTDNLGYAYAFDYLENKLIWAKNYKIPFSSNLKASNNNLFTSNINNVFLILDKKNGNNIQKIPTEEVLVKNNFKDNLSQNENSIFYLNTFGSLYSINQKTFKVNWYINLNTASGSNLTDLFNGNQIINYKKYIVVTSNRSTYVIDANNGSIIYKLNIISKIKPIIVNKYLFLISNNNLLISFNLESGTIVYSYDLNEKISKFLNIKKKEAQFKFFTLANNNLLIILKNSYFLKFDINGKLLDIDKFNSKIKSNPIFINNSILYLDLKNKLLVIN